MLRVIAVFLATAVTACSNGAVGASERQAREGGAMQEMKIEETTVGRIGGWKVAVGNIWDREYKDASGKLVKGPTATVSIVAPGQAEAREEEVGVGSVLDLGEAGQWEVIEVTPGRGKDNGFLRIRRR